MLRRPAGPLISLLLGVATAVLVGACGMAPPVDGVLWVRHFGTTEADRAVGVATDAVGTVFVAGTASGSFQRSGGGGSDVFVVSYDSGGVARWMRTYGTCADEVAVGMVVDSAGRTYVAGTTLGPWGGPSDGRAAWFVQKLDPTGALEWVTRLGPVGAETAGGVALAADGDVLVTGLAPGPGSGGLAAGDEVFLARVGPDGTVRWVRQYESPYFPSVSGAAVDAAGNVYVAGTSYKWTPLLAKFDADGDEIWWTADYGAVGGYITNGIAVDPYGDVVLAGGYWDGWRAQAFVAKFDGDGVNRWMQVFAPDEGASASGVAVDDTGYASVAGTAAGTIGGPDPDAAVYVATFDGDGHSVRIRRLGPDSVRHPPSIAVDPAGSLLLAVTVPGDPTDQVLVMKLTR
jgi:hypothetical protein